MTKIYFAWGMALVATVCLLSISLGNSSGIPVSDEEGAGLVGGQITDCRYMRTYNCNQTYCTDPCFLGFATTPGNYERAYPTNCGTGCTCTTVYTATFPCTQGSGT
jgi:hypothetical protein